MGYSSLVFLLGYFTGFVGMALGHGGMLMSDNARTALVIALIREWEFPVAHKNSSIPNADG